MASALLELSELPIDRCDLDLTNPRRVARAKEESLALGTLEGLSGTFKVLGDPTRLRLLWALDTQELCVCDLAEVVDSTVSAVSHQLRVLRDRRLVRSRREGQLVYYRLDDQHISNLLRLTVNHLEERD